MTSSNRQHSSESVADVLGRIRRKGVKVWLNGGELRYRAPKGVLSREELEQLKSLSAPIVAFLESSGGGDITEPKLESRPRLGDAPLTYSQLAHWRHNRLAERPSVRSIATAMRLHGRLDVDLLRKSLAQVIRRHEALRTQIVAIDASPMQVIAPSLDCDLPVEDLTSLSTSSREDKVRSLFGRVVLGPVCVGVDPLLAVRLACLRDDEHVLVIGMEHIIGDVVSVNILLRDLFALYHQASSGQVAELPSVGVQFADYALWQAEAHRAWMAAHGSYWRQRLQGCGRLRFPFEGITDAHRLGWGKVPVHFDASLKSGLREWCRQRRTTLVMGVLTAFVALVLRWCNVREAVFRYQTDGRFSPKVMNTIGYFASMLHLRVEILDGDTFSDLLDRVTLEYCRAYEHHDLSYLDAQVPLGESSRNCCFNWIASEPKSDSDVEGRQDAITAVRERFANPQLRTYDRDKEPVILLYDTDDEIVGGIHFPLARLAEHTMERFGRNLLVFLESLLRKPTGRINDIILR